MANVEIHELITSEELSSGDFIAEQREDNGLWLTRKLTFNSLGVFLNTVLNYASDLLTTSKTIVGAINELKEAQGVKLTATLTAGNTSITFSDASITASSLIDVYAPIWYSNIAISTGSAVITFPTQASDITVVIKVS